jgi:hypothetical protein
LQGKEGARAGVGIMAAFGVAFTSIFRIVADLFMFAGMVMLRFLVMFFPAVAVLGVMAPMSAIVHRVANMAGASVVNVIAFGAGAAVHTAVVSALLSRAQLGGMNLLVLILCLVTTLVAFVLLFPLLSLTNIVGMSAGGRGVNALQSAGRLAGRYAMTRKAVGDGEQDAKLVGSAAMARQPAGNADRTALASGANGYQEYRMINMPAESFARPEQLAQPRQVAIAADSAVGRGRVPLAELPGGPSVSDAGPLPSSAGRVLTRNLEPIEGVVVEPLPRMPESTVVHDFETVIASDGIGPRLFDPATKLSVPIDRNGNVIDLVGQR